MNLHKDERSHMLLDLNMVHCTYYMWLGGKTVVHRMYLEMWCDGRILRLRCRCRCQGDIYYSLACFDSLAASKHRYRRHDPKPKRLTLDLFTIRPSSVAFRFGGLNESYIWSPKLRIIDPSPFAFPRAISTETNLHFIYWHLHTCPRTLEVLSILHRNNK